MLSEDDPRTGKYNGGGVTMTFPFITIDVNKTCIYLS